MSLTATMAELQRSEAPLTSSRVLRRSVCVAKRSCKRKPRLKLLPRAKSHTKSSLVRVARGCARSASSCNVTRARENTFYLYRLYGHHQPGETGPKCSAAIRKHGTLHARLSVRLVAALDMASLYDHGSRGTIPGDLTFCSVQAPALKIHSGIWCWGWESGNWLFEISHLLFTFCDFWGNRVTVVCQVASSAVLLLCEYGSFIST